ncbi:MAG: NUDIX hydrolase [Parcubacteria group bacterium]|nr:NUDIX hydrolase [Parcubacteria group bacterium]
MKSEYSAGGVVYRRLKNKIQILFILDPYGEWAFPKGHIEEGESTRETTLREIEEETGIPSSDLTVIKGLDKLEYQFTFDDQEIHKLVHFYLLEADPEVKARPQPEEKITAVKWVDIEKAVEFSSYKNAQGILEKAIEIITKSK